MKKIVSLILVLALIAGLALTGCNKVTEKSFSSNDPVSEEEKVGEKVDSEKTDIPDHEEHVNTLSIACEEGTDNCWQISGQTLTFSEITADTICSISGEFDGNILIDVGDDYKFELELKGLTLYSSATCAIKIISADKMTISAKKETENFVYDTRSLVDSESETDVSGAIWADCDLDIQGKGALTVISEHNNGIHTKDDLEIKNITLSVTCIDNALKGNDSVTIESGTLLLISKQGDGIKTTNTDISSKGKQRGIIAISGGDVTIYAARDGIDASYDVDVSETANVTIYTDKYSPYTESTSTKSTSKSSSYSNEATISQDTSLDLFGGMGGPGGMDPGGRGGAGGIGGGGGGGFFPGGMSDGNSNKASYSCKGIKAANEINISGGRLTINSYDDAIHSKNSETLENGETAKGNVNFTNGTANLFSQDDGIHADGTLTISGGEITVSNSYEGLEGKYISVDGGKISVTSSDDGLNATTTSGKGITFTGGDVYVYAGGDGLDSNSRTQYQGISFEGGNIVVVQTSAGNSAIDTEQGYAYSGGQVLAIGPSGGMTSETTSCKNFSSVGTRSTMSLASGKTLSVTVGGSNALSVEMPCSLSAFVVYLGSSSAKFST